MRCTVVCLFGLVCGVLAGCGPGGNTPAAGAGGAAQVSPNPGAVPSPRPNAGAASAADARQELIATAKTMEANSGVEVEQWVKLVENGTTPWSIADNQFLPGKFTPETIAAYKKWRAAKLAENKSKKK